MPSFKVPCPSCEAPVLIKDPKLVGTKVECPKCKYRFKVEEPAADAANPKKADAKDKKADAKKAKAAGGKNKKLVPILVGVGAVVILAVVGIVAFGGSGKKPSPGGSGGGGGGGGLTKGDDEPVVIPPKVDTGPPPVPFSTKNTTNLLPGQSVAVYRFNMDRVRESPAHAALVDPQVRALFRDSMGFEVDEVEAYFHCFTGDTRDAFGIVKLKTPAKPAEVTAKLMLQPKPKAVKGRDLHTVRSNPFVGAVSHALAMRSLLGEVYDRVPLSPPTAPPAKPLGLCVYDTQHILLGDYALMEKFLGELDADGYPPFKTVMNNASAPGAPPAMPPTVPPTAPPAMPPAAPPTAPPAAGDKPFTSVDAYRTVELPLKKVLDAMETDKTTTPLLVYAEKFDARHYDPKQMKKDYQALREALDPIAARTVYLSANVLTFTQRQLVANLRITLAPQAIDDARALAKEQLGPGLTGVAGLLKLYLTVPVEFRDYTKGGTTSDPTGIPMGPGVFPGPGVIGPSAFPGSGMPSGMGPGPTTPPSPLPGPGTFPGPGMPPGAGMEGMLPGFEGMMPGMDDPNRPDLRPTSVSHIDLGMTDNQLLIAIDLSWTDTVFRTTVAPRLVSVTNQIKGKMAVYGSEFSWHAVAAAGPKVLATSERKTFPRGTADRRSDIARFGLPHPPSSRVSLFAELLPYMGRKGLADSLKPGLAWYDPQNLPTPGNDRAGAWVPELLVPDYPQSAWRATSPLAPDHVLGATNYVAIAGRGLNIAREDPANPSDPDFKIKAGITGYGWGSKAEEVTDGLSNTIYMMQTPPGLQQPWIAGGGATVRGFDEADPMGAFKYAQNGRTKPGSYALMGDGSVRFIPADIDPKVLLALSTRAGREALADINTVAPRVEPPKVAVPEPKKEEKKPDDKKEPDPKDKTPDAKAEDKKPADPKKPEDKKEPAKGEVAPPPEKK